MEVFRRLQENNLAINLKKCEVEKSEIKFLGHLVNADGIRPLPEKITAIQNFPKPKVVQELKRSIAMINFYRKFLPQPASYQMLLQELITGNKKMIERPWNGIPKPKLPSSDVRTN